MIVRPPCSECGKEIWGLAKAFHTIGTEAPIHLHASCYEKLKEDDDDEDSFDFTDMDYLDT